MSDHNPPTAELTSVDGLTRNQVVPHYRNLIVWYLDKTGLLALFIVRDGLAEEVRRVNELILSKWKPSGLEYIKAKAWNNLDSENP